MPTEINPPSTISLREITEDTVLSICRLSPAEEQKQFVAPNALSIAEAHFRPSYAWFRAIFADDTPVGFVMLGIDPNEDFCFLWRFMIDAKYQKKGFGKRALDLVLQHIKSKTHAHKVVTSFRKGKGNPGPFYKKMGFIEADSLTDWGELGKQVQKFGEIGLELKLFGHQY